MQITPRAREGEVSVIAILKWRIRRRRGAHACSALHAFFPCRFVGDAGDVNMTHQHQEGSSSTSLLERFLSVDTGELARRGCGAAGS
jgi:hypothetical protein